MTITRKTKTILLLCTCGVGIICFVAYNVVQLMNTFSDKEKENQSSVLFSLTSEDQTKPQVSEQTPTSDYELLRSKQKPYVEGQQRLQEQDSKKQASVSFSSIFTQQSKKTEQPATTNYRPRNSADETLDMLLPKSEEVRPNLLGATKPSQRRKQSYSTDPEYEELEEDIQSFYSPKRSESAKPKASAKDQTSDAPLSDLERKRRALQDGFQIGTNNQTQMSNSNMIPVATRGDQEVASGQSIKLRVLEDCRYNGIDIPRNTILNGRVSVAGSNRLAIAVTTIRVRQQTYSVELHGYDMYGQNGLPLTIDKGKSIGSEEIGDAVEDIARETVGRTTLGKILTGSFGALRREGKRTIIVLDAQKLILK